MRIDIDESGEQGSEVQPQSIEGHRVFMVNPFDEEANSGGAGKGVTGEELAKYLTWTHTIANPYDPDFLMEVNSLVRNLNTSTATPHRLARGMGVVERLDYLATLIQAERQRLETQSVEYVRHQDEIARRYTEEQATEWLKANMPHSYERVNRVSAGSAESRPDLVQSQPEPEPVSRK